MKRVLFTLTAFFACTPMLHSAPIWPLQVGQVWTYECTPLAGGATWTWEWIVQAKVSIGSEEYYKVGDGYFRSTEDKIYEWDTDAGETLFFQVAPVGTKWSHSHNNTVEILDDSFLVQDVYGGPHRAYKLGFSDPHGPWNIYVVPEVGIVQLDQFDESPPYIAELKNMTPGLSFADYLPLNKIKHGVKTFENIYGQSSVYQSYVAETIIVPYTSGHIEATEIVNFWGEGSKTFFACDANSVSLVGWISDSGNVKYVSADQFSSAHPETWTFTDITHGLYVDQGTYWEIDSHLDSNSLETDQALLFTIQDINVPFGHYHDAIVLWWLDKDYDFKPLSFHGKESVLKLISPNAVQTRGYSVTDWEIYGYGTGIIAHGGGDAETGDVPSITVLVDHAVCGDEFHPYPPGDINHDCRVNFLDLAILAESWCEDTAPIHTQD